MRRTVLYAAIAALLGVIMFGPFMPNLDGFLLPVTTRIQPLNPVASAGGLDFRFSYMKFRACSFQGASAFRLDTGAFVEFDVAPGQPSAATRAPGPQVSFLWHLAAPDLAGVKIVFVHDCHRPWGDTLTQVWP